MQTFNRFIGAIDWRWSQAATHIETYWVPKYVDAAVLKLKALYTRTL